MDIEYKFRTMAKKTIVEKAAIAAIEIGGVRCFFESKGVA
jgi:hypothetical protein